MKLLRIILVYLIIVLFGYFYISNSNDEPPTFSNVVTIYQTNALTFKKLAAHVCKLGNNGLISYYEPELENTAPFEILDGYLEVIKGKSVRYAKSKSGQCNITVSLWEFTVPTSGQQYMYKYKVNDVNPYDKNKHTLDRIMSENKDVTFDMPLDVNSNFDDWYFTYIYY